MMGVSCPSSKRRLRAWRIAATATTLLFSWWRVRDIPFLLASGDSGIVALQAKAKAIAIGVTNYSAPAVEVVKELVDLVQMPQAQDNGTRHMTPSGWWPNDDWIGQCVHNVESIQRAKKSFMYCNTKSEWEEYRLGDCIKLCRLCRPSHWNSSFAALYSKVACHDSHNQLRSHLPTVDSIFKRHENDEGFVKPDENALVMHLRLGDVIERSGAIPLEMLMRGATPAHHVSFATAIKSIYEYLTDISGSGVSRVDIVGGAHLGGCKKSWVYATCMRDAIERAGWEVSLQVNGGTPDQDFYFMSHANKIIVSTGGFSRLIGQLVSSHGGKVIGRTFR
eukprot:scaffold669886_cov79-Attheya_sp.AAC.1